MIDSFTVRNFRCFTDLALEPLTRTNLIAGKNNVGKTALLEALWLYHGYFNPLLGIIVDQFRGVGFQKRDELLHDLFQNFDVRQDVELAARSQDNGLTGFLRIASREQLVTSIPHSVAEGPGTYAVPQIETAELSRDTTEQTGPEILLTFTPESGNPITSRLYIEQNEIKAEKAAGISAPSAILLSAQHPESMNTIAERLSNLSVAKSQQKILDAIKTVEPRLQDITIQYRGSTPMIYGDLGQERLLPLPLMGGGVMRLLSISLAIAAARNGAVMIDEVENGLHHTILQSVWRSISTLSKEYNVQVFATTHSLEGIHSAHLATKGLAANDFGLHRLERVDGAIQSVHYDQQALSIAFEEEWEMR